jgi:hypothetical protein
MRPLFCWPTFVVVLVGWVVSTRAASQSTEPGPAGEATAAAPLVFERRYREALVTALIDFRGVACMWNNDYTLAMRAPVEEAEALRPLFNIIRQSVKLDPEWIVRVSEAAGERAKIARDTLEYIQKIDREIVENRARVNEKIRYEGYLLLTGQDDYVNPYTQKVETDTSDFKYRWTTATGDYVYSNEPQFDPNQVREINNLEWKLTPVCAR